jgi:hypothetical protein
MRAWGLQSHRPSIDVTAPSTSASTISGRSPYTATLSPTHARHPMTPSMEPTISSAPAREDSSLTRFPRAVAQQSASITSSENTVQTSEPPSDTEGPILAEEEHIPVTLSDRILNAMPFRTGWSANSPTVLGSGE